MTGFLPGRRGGGWLRLGLRPLAEGEQEAEAGHDGGEHAPEGRPRHTAAGHLGIGRQAVNFRLIDQQIEGVQAAEHLLVGTVEVRPCSRRCAAAG